MLTKTDDTTGATIPVGSGLEVTLMTEASDRAARQLHYASWGTVPDAILRGEWEGDRITRLSITDLDLTKAERPSPFRRDR